LFCAIFVEVVTNAKEREELSGREMAIGQTNKSTGREYGRTESKGKR
jgi:hypothetical protein